MTVLRKIITVCVFFTCLSLGPGVLSLSAQNKAQTSVAMLNYLATEASVISSSQDNRLALENIYNKLINNSNPAVIDETTLDFYQILLDSIESFRIITYQRERLQFLFNNQQAQAITQALPNPLYLLGARDKSPLALIATAATMVIDSVFKYQGAMNDAKLAYLEGDWELDDAQSAILHTLRSRSFVYTVNITTQYRLSGSDSLSEDNIKDFVAISLWDATPRKRQALEANRRLYAKYAPYWLEMAETYYELGMYSECLSAVQEYENVQAPIFRNDKDFARLLPKAIVAANHVHGDSTAYVNTVTRYLQLLVNNISDADWQLRYFAAQTYISLATGSNRNRYLQAAYDLLLNNVRVLSVEHEKTLNEYYSQVTIVPQSLLAALDDAQKKLTQAKIDRDTAVNSRNTRIGREQRTQLDNKVKEEENNVKEWERKITAYRNARERELPPFSQALWVNYELLTYLFEPLNKNDNEITYVYDIIDEALWHYYVMDFYWEDTPYDDYSHAFFIKSTSQSQSIFGAIADGFRYGDRQFFLYCPDAILIAADSIDVKIYNANTNAVLNDEKNVRWEVSSKVNRDYFVNKKEFLAEISILLNTRPDYKRNEAYKMEIYIKTKHEQGWYNRLYFDRPAGKSDWVFDYVE